MAFFMSSIEKQLSHLRIKDEKILSSEVFSALLEFNQHLGQTSHQPVSTEEMERLAKVAWKVHAAYDHRMKQMEQEKAQLQHQIQKMWTLVEGVLYPVLQMDASLLPVYRDLCDIHLILRNLKSHPELFVNHEARRATLILVQDRLHKLEAKKVNGVFMESESSHGRIPSGQAICSSIMEKCYHLVTYLNEHDRDPEEPPSRLEELNTSLVALLGCLKTGIPFDRSILPILKEQLSVMEQHKQQGVWKEEDGTVAPEQESIQKQIDLAHDLLHELELPVPEKVKPMVEEIHQARDTLLEHLEFPGSVTSQVVHTVLDPVYNALLFLEKEAQSVTQGGVHLLRSVVQSTLGVGAHLLHTIQPANDEYTTLESIVARLKGVRAKKATLEEEQFQKEVEVLRAELDRVSVPDAEIKEKDALSLLQDQARVLLQSLL
jgi:hypothetical protein